MKYLGCIVLIALIMLQLGCGDNPVEDKTCGRCGGDGDCVTCGGDGDDGSGYCYECDGSGTCPYCGGDGISNN